MSGTPWTPEQDAILVREYPHRHTAQVAQLIGRSQSATYNRAGAHHGIKKTAEYLSSTAACRLRRGVTFGAAHRFPKGQVPHNKGRKIPGWVRGRMRENWFKPGTRMGQAAKNWKPLGTVMPDEDGYLRMKVAELGCRKSWEFVHHRTWIDAHGPIPTGRALVFRDGNKQNTALANLELITRAELIGRNSIQRLPAELRRAITMKGALKRRIREIREKRNGK